MIQITKWLNPKDETWFKGTYITTYEWLIIQKERIAKITGKASTIRTNSEGYKAVFRKRLK